jgi:hypothetical protein
MLTLPCSYSQLTGLYNSSKGIRLTSPCSYSQLTGHYNSSKGTKLTSPCSYSQMNRLYNSSKGTNWSYNPKLNWRYQVMGEQNWSYPCICFYLCVSSIRETEQRLKIHKHEIILIFFYLNQNIICPWSVFGKKSLLFLRFSPEFRCSNIFAVTEHTWNQIFLASYQKMFVSKCLLWSYWMSS